MTLRELGIDSLSIEERLEIAQQLWDSVAEELQQQPLSEAQRCELERRIVAANARPDEGVAWETVREEARARWPR